MMNAHLEFFLFGIFIVLISNGGILALPRKLSFGATPVVFENKTGANGNKGSTIYAKLIHRDWVMPPSSTMDINDSLFQAPAVPYNWRNPVFLVNVSVGQPPVPQLLLMDTGSPITWVRQFSCLGCEGDIHFYDPHQSTTFVYESCASEICDNSLTRRSSCDHDNRCNLVLAYADGRKVWVTAARETFTFSGLEYCQTVPNIPFGLATTVSDWDDLRGVHGVLGLSPKKGSIIHNYSKFSYCIGNFVNRTQSNRFSNLIIGEDAIFSGSSTPMEMDGYYLINLVGIGVGEKSLDIRGHKVIIDTGAVYTYLQQDAYEQLRIELKKALQGVVPLLIDERMCYEGSIKKILKHFPFVAFYFDKGASLMLEAVNLFVQSPGDMFCLAVKLATDKFDGRSVIGILAQQNYNIAYDLSDKKVYIDRVDCQNLDE